MARNTKKSLAGSAASAARRVLRQKPKSAADPAPTKQSKPAKQATATKKATPAKKTTPAKKATATKKAAPAKKTTTAKKTTPAKKATATKKAAPAKKATATKKATPAKTAATAKKAASAKKAAPATKATATKKATPAKKATAAKKATPATKTTPTKKATATKKATPAKKTAAQLPVLASEEAWSKAELAEVVRELGEQRKHSEVILEAQQADLTGLLHDAGDGAGQDQADVGATSFERDHELTVLNHEREKVAQIERALARIEDGTYGVCEQCGEPIGKNRLMVFPRATLCMTCKQREERR